MRDPNVSLATIVELVTKAKSDADALALTIRKAQKAAGHSMDTRADYAEGSAAAYAYTLSIIAGACGVTNAAELMHGPDTYANATRNFPVDHEEGE